MKYRGKYSLNENLLHGRGMNLLTEGSTGWGAGWAAECTVTFAFGGTLKPNHSKGSHSPARDKQDANIGSGGDNEVKEIMTRFPGITAAGGSTLIPIELQKARTSGMDVGSLTRQFRRHCKARGVDTPWKPGTYDEAAGASVPGLDAATDDEMAEVGNSMKEHLPDVYYVVDFSGGEDINIYQPNISGAAYKGMIPYYTQDRPAAVFEVALGSPVKTVTKTDVKAFLSQNGITAPKGPLS